MAAHTAHRSALLPQETNFDNADEPGIAQPYSQSEVEDLLYGQDRPASERLARLRELRAESSVRESGDWGDEDPAALLDEVDRAIDGLGGDLENADDGEDYAVLSSALDSAQDERLDGLSPDDVDAREAIEQGSEPDDAVEEEEAAEVDDAADDREGK